ncbi:sulfotransferase family 2 domain-containing protein [Hydrogenimonas thermophila]|uniref:sulfotransferase family 2 domain-containing protein n=1 Tax=Hydrogenimonas thermophila TaxID=223786 RepID=UPI002936F64A|nr:sulfotransferase family 2 domain-containing protein [Hydrogenimonas thermophila]WOE69446.1 sulfotransferase family 2 domain-containing protein [Hydrogenimonas thermophila]WOE71956.1 sulfotransferase family 2 domain-containing protein [Hydrogenimonas thermophila]
MITQNDVINVYKGLLGREPESELAIKTHLKNHKTIGSLIRSIKNSLEFKHKYLKENIPEKVVIYIHIPKTAGTFLRSAWLFNNIQKYWWSDEKRPFPQLNNFYENYIIASNYQLVGGHLDINTYLKMKIIQPKVFLNVLREPKSRIISFYNHVKNKDKNHPLHNLVKQHTLYELLESKSEFYKVVFNEQIRYLIANKASLEKFSDRDTLIVGRQDKIDQFVEVSNKLIGFSNGIGKGDANAGGKGYEENVKAEPDFNKALKLLAEMTQKEKKLYDSIESILIMDKAKYKDFIQKFR